MHSIEHLESRIAPASLIGRVLSYTDIDGDKVTVAFSKGSLSSGNFIFDNTFGSAFIKSRIVVGSTFGADMTFGTADDVINAASKLNTLVVKGTVFGAVGGTDSHFIEAGRIGSANLAGRSIPVTAGGNMSTVSASGDVFLRDVV